MSRHLDNIEQELFIEAVRKKYGYDFRNYSRSSINRRIRVVQEKFSIETVAEMISQALLNYEVASEFIRQMSIVHTDLFRDPAVFQEIKKLIVPDLKTYPYLKIWHAGCATGEEVYSFAILLLENGLYDRTQLYATDYNQAALNQASIGEYEKTRWQSFSKNYLSYGGGSNLGNYFHLGDNFIQINDSLKKNITFSSHNLVCDGVFGEMNLIMCRNVMIYFDSTLKKRVLQLFTDSLDHRGYLCIGKGEDIDEDYLTNNFQIISNQHRILRKKHREVAK